MKSIFEQNKKLITLLLTLLCLSLIIIPIESREDFEINEHDTNDEYEQDTETYQEEHHGEENRQPSQEEIQYFSQRRTACLVLSRYYLNQFGESINDIVKGLAPQDQTVFINKLYATAVEKCEPLIGEMEVMQFFTSTNENFDPSGMYHIFDGFNFYEISIDSQELTSNQKSIVKFIKEFDDQMEVRKEEQEAQKMSDERDEGIQVFFISIKNLSPQAKYLYIILVLLICSGILYYGFSQIGQKPEKKDKKKKKQQ